MDLMTNIVNSTITIKVVLTISTRQNEGRIILISKVNETNSSKHGQW